MNWQVWLALALGVGAALLWISGRGFGKFGGLVLAFVGGTFALINLWTQLTAGAAVTADWAVLLFDGVVAVLMILYADHGAKPTHTQVHRTTTGSS